MNQHFAQPLEHPRVSSDLRWLAGLLWGPGARVVVGPAGRSETRGWDRFAIVGGASSPRFLVPMSSRRAGEGTLRSYNALRPPVTRLVRSGLATAIGLRIDRPLAPEHLLVEPSSSGGASLQMRLAEIFGREDLTFAVGVGVAGPNRKPTLRVVSLAGEPLGFAKVGWNVFTRELVQREAAALRAWGQAPRSAVLGAPGLIDAGPWNDLELSVVTPLPRKVRRHPSRRLPPLQATLAVARLEGSTTSTLAESDYLEQLRKRLKAVAPVVDGSEERTMRAVEVITDRAGDRSVEIAAWHGDWTPWNLSWDGGRLYAIDWEHSGRAPLGFDILHYHFATAFYARRVDTNKAATTLRQSARRVAGLGVDENLGRTLAALYLLELLARASDGSRGGAGTNARLLPALLDTIDATVQDIR